jgi:hypothetical protein
MNFNKTQLKFLNGMPMKGLRRNDDAIKYRSWYKKNPKA